jgi:hypothetical protein
MAAAVKDKKEYVPVDWRVKEFAEHLPAGNRVMRYCCISFCIFLITQISNNNRK